VKIIDLHHHLLNEDHYVDSLLREMDRCGVEKIGLSALDRFGRKLFLKGEWNGKIATNKECAAAAKAHPDRIVGFGFIQLGVDRPAIVDELMDMGFTGLKFHFPTVPYDAPQCFEVYERANRYRTPMLFHTGIFTLPEPMSGERVGSAQCQPVLVDAVANTYPNLRIILAHMGIGWYDVAATMARILPNVYVDFSGNLNGWRLSHPPQYWKDLLYWPDAPRKILFGSDIHWKELEPTISAQRKLFQDMGFTAPQLDRIFHDNAAEMLAATTGGRTA
jgi:predicted TIM-barrel fold metal-dependent hydrolase